MKKILTLFLITQVLVSCEQVLLVPVAPEPVEPPPPCGTSPSAGSASFTKFVALGSAYVSGFQAGALYNDGQANSLARIMARQFECVGGSATFNQPDIGSANGYNIQLSVPGVITLGRLVLFDPDGTSGPRTPTPQPSAFPGSSVTCPSPVTTPALPAPYNTADLPAPFTGNKTTLNNFGVPLIYLGQALIAQTGGPPTANPFYNPMYARFASNPGTSTLLGDALAAGGSFYLIWLGVEDALLYAALGASSTYPLTSEAAFTGQYTTAITTMLGANPAFKGVVGNIPSITTLPYFFTVPWNTITLDAATAATLTTNLATGYNAFLDAMVTNMVITSTERDKRRLTYIAGKNGVLLTDETLTDLSSFMAGPYAALLPYAKARQATATDLVPLGAGAVLGTCFGGSASAILGVSYPVEDKHMLTVTEITEIETRIAAFNTTIANVVAGSSNRLALADVKTAYADLVAAKLMVFNGVTISPSFAPPTGAFSLDGLLPNNRGNAFTANVFIDAINAKFGASVPKASLADYSATGLPVNPL
jgi:hypothetical protein